MPPKVSLAPVSLARTVDLPPATVVIRTPMRRKRGTSDRGPRDPQTALLAARQATAPRRQDLLGLELAHGRISRAEFEVGRRLEALFERARSGAISSWRGIDHVDGGFGLTEALIVDRLTSARAVARAMQAVEAAVGPLGVRVLRHTLDDRADLETLAVLVGVGDGARGANVAGWLFRIMLRELSDAWGARGAEPAIAG